MEALRRLLTFINHEQLRTEYMRHGFRESGFITLITASRALLKSTASIAFAATLVFVSACTPTSGPSASTTSFGVTTGEIAQQTQLAGNADTTPDQAAAVVVGSNTGNTINTANTAPDSLTAIADNQAFVPGAIPPSATLQTALTSETSVNSQAADSGNYVTDGVEKPIKNSAASPAPLTPADVAAQVPVPLEPEQVAKPETAKQVASLDVSEPEAALEAAPAIADPIVTQKSARSDAAEKPTLFGGLFGNKPKKQKQSLSASPEQGEVQLASLKTSNNDGSDQTESMNSLPGVNTKNLFALDPSGKNGGEEEFEEEPQVQLASAAGMARLAPNGLLKQTDRVDVGCFRPELVSVLKKIETHYGQKVVVTSGYRSPQGNRRAGGSRHSLHMMCAAADIQVSGVGKWELAKYMRSMPGRGGVGTYCYTDSVHIDVGSERDWNWRCRRR